ncbi:SDR family NAD(P)-dependent oxidoreductase [Bradyrhizobium sp.]|uniref:SDR family NAD(P)-dependent oxidoreductase n=1 Tax=Bradyrhizobium sp. TaxID=376 RepID=UPI0039E61C6D
MKTQELFDVAGLSVVITGGAKGLGRAFAEAMLDNGAKVALLDRDAAILDATVSELSPRGEVAGIAVDVTDRKAVKSAVDQVVARTGRLDVVFANAGIDAGPGFLSISGERDPEGAIESIPDGLWDKVIDTNLTSVFATLRASVPHMKRQRSGRIILTASIAGVRPGAIVGMPYQISKAGVAHLAKQSALELAKYNILVNAILPGPFLTQLTTPDLKKRFEAGSPIHRVGQPEEIQGLALFLASPASSYITGTHIVIDGGALLGRAD